MTVYPSVIGLGWTSFPDHTDALYAESGTAVQSFRMQFSGSSGIQKASLRIHFVPEVSTVTSIDFYLTTSSSVNSTTLTSAMRFATLSEGSSIQGPREIAIPSSFWSQMASTHYIFMKSGSTSIALYCLGSPESNWPAELINGPPVYFGTTQGRQQAKDIYIGVSGPKKVKGIYIGVGGSIKKIYP